MKQSIIKYAFLFAAILWFGMQGATAQRPVVVGPVIRPNPAVQKEAQRQAAANKILDSTVSKVVLQLGKIPYMTGTFQKYKTASIELTGNGGPFNLKQKLDNNSQRTYPYGKSEPFTETYSLVPGSTSSYRDLLRNGFLAKIDLTNRKDDFKYKCDITLVFYFSNGSSVAVPLQGITIGNNKEGFFKSNGNDLHVSQNVPGNSFPDPDNPYVAPVVK